MTNQEGNTDAEALSDGPPFTVEMCDGLPSDVEKGTITSDRYCPWSVKVIAIDE